MYIDEVPNRGSPPAILLRKAWREGKIIRKKTLDNLSKWPPEKVELLRRVLRGETLVPVGEVFATERSLPHDHVEAVLGTIRKLGLGTLIASKGCREGDLAVAVLDAMTQLRMVAWVCCSLVPPPRVALPEPMLKPDSTQVSSSLPAKVTPGPAC